MSVFADESTVRLAVSAFAALSACAVLYVLHKLHYSGAFQILVYDWKDLPNDRVVMFKRFKGTYNGVARNFERIMAMTNGYDCPSEAWAFFFDHPNTVGDQNCRYAIGIVLNGEKTAQLEKILVENGFVKLDDIPPKLSCLHLTFPFTGVLSIMVCVFRVYNKAFERECARLGIDTTKNKFNKDGTLVEVTRGREGVTEMYFVTEDVKEFLKLRLD